MPTKLYDENAERINCAADWLISRTEEWAVGKLPSYVRLCRQISANAQSIRNVNKPGVNGSSDVGILTLVDRIGAILYDDYFAAVTGEPRLKLARYKVNVIRGAAFARSNAHNYQEQAQTYRQAAHG